MPQLPSFALFPLYLLYLLLLFQLPTPSTSNFLTCFSTFQAYTLAPGQVRNITDGSCYVGIHQTYITIRRIQVSNGTWTNVGEILGYRFYRNAMLVEDTPYQLQVDIMLMNGSTKGTLLIYLENVVQQVLLNYTGGAEDVGVFRRHVVEYWSTTNLQKSVYIRNYPSSNIPTTQGTLIDNVVFQAMPMTNMEIDLEVTDVGGSYQFAVFLSARNGITVDAQVNMIGNRSVFVHGGLTVTLLSMQATVNGTDGHYRLVFNNTFTNFTGFTYRMLTFLRPANNYTYYKQVLKYLWMTSIVLNTQAIPSNFSILLTSTYTTTQAQVLHLNSNAGISVTGVGSVSVLFWVGDGGLLRGMVNVGVPVQGVTVGVVVGDRAGVAMGGLTGSARYRVLCVGQVTMEQPVVDSNTTSNTTGNTTVDRNSTGNETDGNTTSGSVNTTGNSSDPDPTPTADPDANSTTPNSTTPNSTEPTPSDPIPDPTPAQPTPQPLVPPPPSPSIISLQQSLLPSSLASVSFARLALGSPLFTNFMTSLQLFSMYDYVQPSSNSSLQVNSYISNTRQSIKQLLASALGVNVFAQQQRLLLQSLPSPTQSITFFKDNILQLFLICLLVPKLLLLYLATRFLKPLHMPNTTYSELTIRQMINCSTVVMLSAVSLLMGSRAAGVGGKVNMGLYVVGLFVMGQLGAMWAVGVVGRGRKQHMVKGKHGEGEKYQEGGKYQSQEHKGIDKHDQEPVEWLHYSRLCQIPQLLLHTLLPPLAFLAPASAFLPLSSTLLVLGFVFSLHPYRRLPLVHKLKHCLLWFFLLLNHICQCIITYLRANYTTDREDMYKGVVDVGVVMGMVGLGVQLGWVVYGALGYVWVLARVLWGRARGLKRNSRVVNEGGHERMEVESPGLGLGEEVDIKAHKVREEEVHIQGHSGGAKEEVKVKAQHHKQKSICLIVHQQQP